MAESVELTSAGGWKFLLDISSNTYMMLLIGVINLIVNIFILANLIEMTASVKQLAGNSNKSHPSIVVETPQ